MIKRIHSFRTKLSIALSLVSIVMVLVIGLISWQVATSALRNLSVRLSERNIQNAVSSTSGYLQEVHSVTTSILQDDVLRTAPKDISESDIERISASINRTINAATDNDVFFQAVEFYSANGIHYAYPSEYYTGISDYTQCAQFLEANGLAIESTYTRTQWRVFPLQNREKKTTNSLACVRYLYDNQMQKKGVLLAFINEDELAASFTKDIKEAFIVSNEGIVLSTLNGQHIGKPMSDNTLFQKIYEHRQSTFTYFNNQEKELMYSCSPTMDNTAVLVVPFDGYTGIPHEEFYSYILSIVILMVCGVFAAVALGVGISHGLSKSLSKLAKTVNRIDSGQLDLRCDIDGQDEIAYLGEKINNMLDSINAFMVARENDLEAQRLLEVKFLQSQINPHLLYNTLDSVLWYLQQNNNGDAMQLMTDLSGFFKISLSKGRSEIPLQEELQLIAYYLEIQHFARQQDVQLQVDIPAHLLNGKIIKLLLQPIVENAIIHGFSGYRDDGIISVQAQLNNGDLWITIRDNGIGMTEEEVKSIQDTLRIYPPSDTMRHFGLYNINWRIKKEYGAQYGVSVESKATESTTVVLKLPYHPM